MSTDATNGSSDWQADQSFTPSREFTAQANASDPAIYDRAAADPEAFWAGYASKLQWIEPWSQILEWNPPHAQWFVGGKLNVSANCLDRHLAAHGNRRAIVWEGEPGDQCTLTYGELSALVNQFANVLKQQGVGKGDRVSIYMPMVPEAAVAMLACTRLGALHSVVFGGFSVESLAERTNDCGAKVIVTADGYWRRGNIVPLKSVVDEALPLCPTVERAIVLRRAGDKCTVKMKPGRDVWWHDLMQGQSTECAPEPMDAEDPLFILYTSGSTGKPKGILHTTGGYLTGAFTTTQLVFDIKPTDLYWCTADIGWITGHSYVVYGPLANCATVFMYEGSPDWSTEGAPCRDRFWDMIERHKITILYTAPTLIRACMKWGEEHPAKHDLSSLRLLGSVGEPINPEAWLWYHRHIGHEKCPIVDTWWQTETGSIMITSLPGLTTTHPGSATRPFPGISVDVVDDMGRSVPPDHKGILVITKPWPSMLRTIWGDDHRYNQVYWSRFPGLYFPGDGALRDQEGNYWLLGRVDDIMLVAGHNLSTMELESVLVEHPAVAEAAVIGRSHDVKGQAPVAFVIVREEHAPPASDVEARKRLAAELKEFVSQRLGAVCRPDEVIISGDLPKTRSGKIMRRLLRDIAEGRVLGDTSTLADPNIVAGIKSKYGSDDD